MSKKIALITGVTGQDGSYLAELLIEKGYEVHGTRRRSSSLNTFRIDHIFKENQNKLNLHYADLGDFSSLHRLISSIQPDEIYNLGAQSHVGVSFDIPEYSADVNATGTLRMLDAIIASKVSARFYQASTSELFGGQLRVKLDEGSPLIPRSPYATAKLYAYWITKNYREAYNLFAVNGILFNHESPRRGVNFVTQKIVRELATYKLTGRSALRLGNLYASRDWGHARDYVRAMWLMLQAERADDYVVATGETHTVKEFLECCLNILGISYKWCGKGIEEKCIDRKDGAIIAEIDPQYFRPLEVEHLLGDPSKIMRDLGWAPEIKFHELAEEMIQAELERQS